MFVFGHLGIGNKIASPWSRNLPKIPLFLGMLLPDLIDKPLFYLHIWPYVSCTRTFAHSAVFLLLIMATSGVFKLLSSSKEAAARSLWLAALALGVSTHLLLDCLIDRVHPAQTSAALVALTWPFLHTRFAQFTFKGMADHAMHLLSPPILISEGVGLALLGWDYWKSRHRGAILKVLFSRRWRLMKRWRLERD